MALTLKTRLTLWHAGTVAVILAVTIGGADWWLGRAVTAQVDAALVALAETEAASALDRDGPDALEIHLHEVVSAAGAPILQRLDKLAQVVDVRGGIVARSATLGEATLPAPPALLERLARGEVVIETITGFQGDPVRLASLPIEVEGAFRYAIQVGTSLGPTHSFLRTARILFGVAATLILVAIVATGRLLTARALGPMDRVVARALTIGASTLGERLPAPEVDDELGRLVVTLNEMLGRIERSVESQRRFTADAAHELRSPLSRLRAELEITLRRPRGLEEYEAALRSCLEEVERLGALTEALLTLARLDAGEARADGRIVTAVASVVQDTLRHLAGPAERRKIRVVCDTAVGIAVNVAPGLLALVLGNLVDNAIKFSPPGTEVHVTAGREDGSAVLAVSDSGPGIAVEEAPRVFDRFYRGRAAGAPDAQGVGLGLAIVRGVVEAHGGSVSVASAPAGAGATFRVRLPLAG
jgi:two-component system OmpR family sensor kinase